VSVAFVKVLSIQRIVLFEITVKIEERIGRCGILGSILHVIHDSLYLQDIILELLQVTEPNESLECIFID
jgi:hypothetical protein